MPTEITMPKLSDTMEEGTILRWFKHAGDSVAAGEMLAEVETDKADMEIEATASGTLREIRVKEGDAAAVGAVIAVLDGADESAAERPPAPAASAAEVPAAARERPAAAPPRPPAAPSPQPLHAVPPASGGPAARVAVPPSRPARAAAPEPGSLPAGPQALSKLRLTVAKQMSASKRDIPHFYVTNEIDMTEAARLRTSLAASAALPERITFTHLLLRALALALPRHPHVNASWAEDRIVYHDQVNIGVAVAIADGLVAPVVRNCDRLSLRGIARLTDELVAKAQAGRFAGEELTGATFTLSNMGMLDVEEFSAVITPPQAAILAVGAIKDRPVVRDGQLAVAKTMRATLSVDHRVLNGIEAARFLEDLKTTLENPLVLVLAQD